MPSGQSYEIVVWLWLWPRMSYESALSFRFDSVCVLRLYSYLSRQLDLIAVEVRRVALSVKFANSAWLVYCMQYRSVAQRYECEYVRYPCSPITQCLGIYTAISPFDSQILDPATFFWTCLVFTVAVCNVYLMHLCQARCLDLDFICSVSFLCCAF